MEWSGLEWSVVKWSEVKWFGLYLKMTGLISFIFIEVKISYQKDLILQVLFIRHLLFFA